MKVIINGRFLLHKITGVERYAREICKELDKLVKPNEIEIAVPPELNDLPKFNNIKVKRIGKLHNRMWEQISFPVYVKKENALSLNLCNMAPLISPDYVTVHDVKIRATPQFYKKRFIIWYRLIISNIAKRARKIITVSEFSKKEIKKYYPIEEKK
ncbi:MAG: hypothetical protein LIP10_13955 [Clostridiales bacterium]|nr:hypothetical protein [Clostridiales bacterium]